MTPKVAYLIGKLAAAAGMGATTMQGTNTPQTNMSLLGPAKPNPKINPGTQGWTPPMQVRPAAKLNLNTSMGGPATQMPGGTQ
jgi:hypothetical protein